MGLRLSKEELEKFIDKYDTELMVQHGRTMKEYVQIPQDLLNNKKKYPPICKKVLPTFRR